MDTVRWLVDTFLLVLTLVGGVALGCVVFRWFERHP